jgi:hypothetical protein
MTIRGQMIATRRRLRRLRGRTIATWTVLSVIGYYLPVGPAWTVVAEVFARSGSSRGPCRRCGHRGGWPGWRRRRGRRRGPSQAATWRPTTSGCRWRP